MNKLKKWIIDKLSDEVPDIPLTIYIGNRNKILYAHTIYDRNTKDITIQFNQFEEIFDQEKHNEYI